MRCGRCGDDWALASLHCPYCGATDHNKLGSLILEGEVESRKVDTCTVCHGYLKAMATLRALPATDIMLADLATVELDLVALDKGYQRPAPPGAPITIRLVATKAESNGVVRGD